MRAVLLGIALTVLLAGSARAATFHGVMTNGGGAVRSGEQGALWQSRFGERAAGRVRYSACVIFLGERGVVRCKAGRTSAAGTSRLSFSQFVNQRPGRWVVRFFRLGQKLSAWRFVVRPEGD